MMRALLLFAMLSGCAGAECIDFGTGYARARTFEGSDCGAAFQPLPDLDGREWWAMGPLPTGLAPLETPADTCGEFTAADIRGEGVPCGPAGELCGLVSTYRYVSTQPGAVEGERLDVLTMQDGSTCAARYDVRWTRYNREAP